MTYDLQCQYFFLIYYEKNLKEKRFTNGMGKVNLERETVFTRTIVYEFICGLDFNGSVLSVYGFSFQKQTKSGFAWAYTGGG